MIDKSTLKDIEKSIRFYDKLFDDAILEGVTRNLNYGVVNLFYVMDMNREGKAYTSVVNRLLSNGYVIEGCPDHIAKEYNKRMCGMDVFVKISW